MRYQTVILVCAAFYGLGANAKDVKSTDSQSTLDEAQPANVEKIQEKYWANGDESELGVVQNRSFSKSHKFEFGLMSGIVATDPFLNVNNLGFDVGYNFNEYFSLYLIGFKDFVNPSSALTTFQNTIGATTDNNPPSYYLGTELNASILYGKLSLLGKAILHYDMHLLGGLGLTNTFSGTYFTPSLGLGQQIYLTKSLALRVDYRLMLYNETIIEQVIPTKLGQPVGNRLNFTNSITVGVDFLWGGLK